MSTEGHTDLCTILNRRQPVAVGQVLVICRNWYRGPNRFFTKLNRRQPVSVSQVSVLKWVQWAIGSVCSSTFRTVEKSRELMWHNKLTHNYLVNWSFPGLWFSQIVIWYPFHIAKCNLLPAVGRLCHWNGVSGRMARSVCASPSWFVMSQPRHSLAPPPTDGGCRIVFTQTLLPKMTPFHEIFIFVKTAQGYEQLVQIHQASYRNHQR